MTRGEIREGIAGRYCYRFYGSLLSYLVGRFGEDDYRVKVSYKYADDEMSALHSQGAVIKVERELPRLTISISDKFHPDCADMSGEWVRPDANYGEFEPLIEDGHSNH